MSGSLTINTDRQRIFKQIQPYSVGLSEAILVPKPDPRLLITKLSDFLGQLRRTVSTDGHTFDANIGYYVLIPLNYVLERYKQLSDRSIELALQCLEQLLASCWRININEDFAKKLLIQVTFIIGGVPGTPGTQDQASTRSDETRLAGTRCLLRLFESLSRSPDVTFTKESNMPELGHTISTMLDTLKQSETLELQLALLEAISMLFTTVMTRDGDVLASFYPGVLSSLVIVIGLGTTTRRPYKVLVGAIKLANGLVVRVLGEKAVAQIGDDGAPDSAAPEKLKIKRTAAWLRLTVTNTRAALQQLLKLRMHPRLEVRQAVFDLTCNLLSECPCLVKEAVTLLVETLIVISGDADDSLAKYSENTVRVMATTNLAVKNAVRACLDHFISTLPRAMGGNDEDTKERLINRLSIAFGLCSEMGIEIDLLRDMLADSIKDSLLAAVPLSKAAPTLTTTQQSQSRPQILLTEADELASSANTKEFPDVIMAQRSQINTLQSMRRLLSALGKSSDDALNLAVVHVRSASSRVGSLKEQATSMWVASNLLRSSVAVTDEMEMFLEFEALGSSHLRRNVTDEFLALALSQLNAPSENSARAPDADLVQCLALEALSLVAESQKTGFRSQLVEALYPVVHHLGDPSMQVQNHAIIALNNITAACGYGNAAELLLDNVDYMVNAVSLKLNMFDLSPQAPLVLNMMLKLAGPRLVPFLDDLVGSMFTILEGFHDSEQLCEDLFMVLGAVVEESAKGDETKLQIEAGGETLKGRHKRRKILSDEKLFEALRQARIKDRELPEHLVHEDFPHRPWGKKKEPFEPPDIDLDESPPPPPPEEEPPKLSKTYEMVQRITRLSQHYLTHPSYRLRANLIHLVSTAVTVLAPNENEFLPVVNDIWPVAYDRLNDPEPAIIALAAETVSRIVEAAGDFMAKRIKDTWPAVKKLYLKFWRELERERRQRAGGMGIHSTNYKAWDALVKMLGVYLRCCRLEDVMVDEILGACKPALKEREDLRAALEDVAPDALWLEMESMDQKWEGKPPRREGVVFAEVVF